MDEEMKKMFKRQFEALEVGFKDSSTNLKKIGEQLGKSSSELDQCGNTINQIDNKINQYIEIEKKNQKSINKLMR